MHRIQIRAILGIGLFAGTLYWAWPILLALHDRWMNAAVERGYAVVAMVLILLVLQVRRTERLGVPSPSGLVVFVLSISVATFARAGEVILVQQLLLPVIVFGAIASYAGWRIGLRFGAPLAMLYFAMPFWQAMPYLGMDEPWLAGALRDMTVAVASAAVRLVGIPAFIENDFIHLPDGTVEVAEGCSGRAYFIVALELALFYSIAFLRSWASRLKLVAAAALLAMAGNWLRVFLLVLIGYFSGMGNPLMEDHETFGWLIFCLVLAPLFYLASRLESREGMLTDSKKTLPESGRPYRWIPYTTAGLLVIAIAASLRIDVLYARESVGRTVVLAAQVPGSQRVSAWSGETRPRFVGEPVEFDAVYRYRGKEIGAFVAHYPVQRQGSEVVHYRNSPVGAASAAGDAQAMTIDTGALGRFEFRRLREAEGTRIVWFGMRVAGRSTANPLRAKLFQIEGLARGRTDAEGFVFSLFCADNCGDAGDTLTEFARIALPVLITDIENTGARQRSTEM